MIKHQPYGTWHSPISADALTAGAVSLGDAKPHANAVFWSESRPSEGGRTTIMRERSGVVTEITPQSANVRTTVHEYGGGSWQVHEDTLFYIDYADQRLRALDTAGQITFLTPEAETEKALRYADFVVSDCGTWLIAVHETHKADGDEPSNCLVAIPTNGSQELILLASGSDFYGSPRISPDNTRLAWIQWQHPNMPWDTTELCAASITVTPQILTLGEPEILAGGNDEAIIQPEFSPQGKLHYLSDRNDLWHLYCEGNGEAVLGVEGEIGTPPWVFGQSRYAFLADGSVVFAETRHGIDFMQGYPQYSAVRSIRTDGDSVTFIASAWDQEAVVVHDGQVVTESRDLHASLGITSAYLHAAEALEFETTDGESAYALYFAPANPEYAATEPEKPPLIVLAHGGPTSCARSELHLARQFWTSRGFAVADVNYRGSSGFGRQYRQKLNLEWGIADVEDCVNVARFLVKRGDVDPERLIIRGGSAGGFTVLSALAFHDMFTAGANLYGVADLEALADDTHKFESRYLDNLVGPYPQQRERYRARSPIHHLSGFNRPMIVLQGSEDAIVPPNQSRMIVTALQKRKVPVAYLEFEGEQHGFRRAETIITALNSELGFYGQVFGFIPDNDGVTVDIANLNT